MDEELLFQPAGRRARVSRGQSFMAAAAEAGVALESACGGKGQCGKCQIKPSAPATPATEEERALLGDRLEQGYRLACLARPLAGGAVWVPARSRRHGQVILTQGYERELELDPAVAALELQVAPAELGNAIPDRERLLAALAAQLGPAGPAGLATPLHFLQELPAALRAEQGRVTVLLHQARELLAVYPGWGADCLGLAIDLGSTTMVAYLLDLAGGQLLAVRAGMNPQLPFGDDVISRISHALGEEEGLPKLAGAAREGLNRLIAEVCKEAGKRPEGIVECLMVGNTAMHHLFLGLDPGGLPRAPYVPVAGEALEIKAREVGLHLAPEAWLHWLPVKAGFVGADLVAAALALSADEFEQPSLLVDLGTNGEMLLARGTDMLCCSTAAGPAFEGGHIRWGMRGAPGAIEAVELDSARGEPRLRVIGQGRPRGICGSGLVSLVNQLLKAGLITAKGSLVPEAAGSRVRQGEDGLEYVVAWSHQAQAERDIVLTAHDVSELQLAKAAIQAGVQLMMHEMSVPQIHRVFLAGAFGNYLAPADAVALGLFPGVTPEQVQPVGNAAGTGAMLALCSLRLRRKAQELASKMRYLELAAHPGFQGCFVDGLAFLGARG